MSIVEAEEDSFMRDLISLMGTPEFKRFQQRHMGNSVEAKTSFVYFELYRAINEIYVDMMGEEMPDDMKSVILRSIMRRGQYRKPLIATVLDYLDGSSHETVLRDRVREVLMGAGNLLTLT
jgi:hypothetical protein